MAQDKHFGGGALCEGVLEDFGLKTTNRKKRLAFSIAEAMITLLIVSLALAAAAPIMSKNMKSSSQAGQFMTNEVKFFNADICPIGWERLQANDGTDAAGAFIRIAGVNGRAIENGADRRGEIQEAGLPNISGSSGPLLTNTGGSTNGAITTKGGANAAVRTTQWAYLIGGITFDAARSHLDNPNITAPEGYTSVYKNDVFEVRPRNIALIACVKTR